ncbi:hypothetical protein G7Y89_g5900 [Cudoniella acicularis]|uniref:Uncharacterized protein n=1 Tax=Cudoniella acicularis TaxID=354080 RepID=A0A8H4RLJ0_9HELO|nr:hypothetical protein G7Y89_g5900 [Cudoniella acicularis]
MLFSEEDAPLLKKWIVKRLENTSDADADVLADYVLALLRHDGDTETVRQLCLVEIPDFLKEDSHIFVQDVFDAIHYKSYLPGAQPPRRPSIPFAPPTGPSMPSYGSLGMAGVPQGPQNGSRKRSYNDRGDGDPQDRGLYNSGDPNGRLYKQPRRGGIIGGRGGYEHFNGRGGYPGGRPLPMNLPGPPSQGFPMPGMPSPPPGMPAFDPNNPMAAMLAMQAMGFPVPGLPISPGIGGQPPPIQPKRQRCRDYDLKGFCARGNTCNFEHGENSIFVPPGNKSDEYDPTNATLMTGVEGNAAPPAFNNFRGNDRGRGRGGFSRGDRGGNPSRRGGRAEFSSDRPNHDKSKMTIVVENIPEDKFSEDEVRQFFSQFGNILEVSMRPYKRLAIVKYSDWNEANAAYSSPKVIFDNRFVKVYWYTSPESLPQPPAASASNDNAMNGAAPITPAPARAASEPEIDIEEFARKQQEAQKVHEEKMKKKQEMEAARKELEKRQEDLAKSRAEEKRKLMEKLAAKTAKSGMTIIKTENGSPPPSNAKSNSQTEALKAQLAALEAEAQSLGIDPNAAEDNSFSYRGRGRGRGGYRGRGAFAPRGFRGSFRGRGGAPFSGGGTYKLDNRPKTVALTGVDFSDPEKDESLRQFLLGIGEYASLEVTPSRASITFKDRFTAEKFMYGLHNGEVPSVGKVDLAWVSTPLPPINLASIKTEDITMDEGDAMMMATDSSPAHGVHDREQVENIDYDVADDNDWGVQ